MRGWRLAMLNPRWRHLTYAQLILTFSVVVFAFGPWHYPVSNPLSLFAYLIAGQLFLAVGYTRADWRVQRPWKSLVRINTLVSVGSILSITYSLYFGLMKKYLPSISESIADIGMAYRITQSLKDSPDATIFDWARTALSPLVFLPLPIVIIFWSEIKAHGRILAIAAAVLDAMLWIRRGTNRGLGHLMIIIFAAGLLRYAMRNRKRARLKSMKKIFGLCLAGVLFVAFFTFFTQGRLSRNPLVGEYYTHDNYTEAYANPDHWLIRIMPPYIGNGILSLSHYWVHGYYGLSLCLQQEFVWAYGFGHSSALRGLMQSMGIDSSVFTTKTYAARTEVTTGYPFGIKWHSLYSALASDLTFLGALLAMAGVGMLFSTVAREAIQDRNPFAACVYCCLWITIIFVPANNQLGMDRRLLLSFYGVFILWLLSRRKRHRPMSSNALKPGHS